MEQAQQRSQLLSALEKQSSSREIELQIAQEELSKRTDELKIVKMANTQAQNELVYMRRLVDGLNLRLKEAIEISMKDRIRANKMETASFTAAEDWRAELEAMEKQSQAEISWLQKENEKLKLEFLAAVNARDEAMILARNAMLAGEVATKQAEFLSNELGKAKAAVAISSQETKKIDQALYEFAKQKADLTEAYAICHTAAQAGAAMVAEKEAELKKQITASFQAKHQAELLRWELFESRQNEMKLCEMDNELEVLKEQLAVAKQMEHQQAKVVIDTNDKLQEAYSEMHQAKAAQIEAAAMLTSVHVEVEEYRRKWNMACEEASTLMANLESMTNECKTQQMQMMKLQERESHACAQAADKEAMLLEASEELAKAIAREQIKDETLNHLTCLLDGANLEAQTLRQQMYVAVFEAHLKSQEAMISSEVEAIEEVMSLQQILKVAECIASETQVKFQEILRELYLARELAGNGSAVKHSITECTTGHNQQQTMKDSFECIEVDDLAQDRHCLKQALKACQPAALSIAHDLEVTREQLETARAEVEMLKAAAFVAVSETNHAKQEREQAQMGMAVAREETLAEREQVRVAREEALAATAKLEQLQQKFTQASENASNAKKQGKSRELSEPWEMVEAVVTIKQEEYDALKFKVHEAVEFKSLIETELLSLRCLNQRLSAQLNATNMEIQALRISEQNTRQQYDEVQRGNLVLEAEVQRLKGEGEQLLRAWEIEHDAYGSDANTLQSSQVIPLESKLQSPQATPLESKLEHYSLPHSIYSDLSSSQKDEEESSEFLPLSTKKKKKALFLRIATFITKKTN